MSVARAGGYTGNNAVTVGWAFVGNGSFYGKGLFHCYSKLGGGFTDATNTGPGWHMAGLGI